MTPSLSVSILITMGAPAEREVAPMITGVVSETKFEVSMLSVGGSAAVVVLKTCVALPSLFPRPVSTPLETPAATEISMVPLESLAGVTSSVYSVALTAEKVPLVPFVTPISSAVKPVTPSEKVKVNVTGPEADPGVSSVIVTVGLGRFSVAKAVSKMSILPSSVEAVTVSCPLFRL